MSLCPRYPSSTSPASANTATPECVVHLRDEARIEADVRGKSITIFDCRPPWHANLTEWSRVPVAQLRFSSDDNSWFLYWADRNARWHRYEETGPGTVEQLLSEIDSDPICVFWG